MAPESPSISETELDVLKALWDLGSGTVRQVNDVLRQRKRQWAYTTVLTLLRRLRVKGYVTSDKSEMAHVFRPAISRDGLLGQRLSHLADDLCEGMATRLVHALVQKQRFSHKEIEGFRQLLDELDSKPEATAKKPHHKPRPKSKT